MTTSIKYPVHNPPLLSVTDACGVKPIGQLIGGPAFGLNELTTGAPLWQFGAHRKRCCEGDESQVKGALHPDYPRQRGSLDSRWCYLANCLCGLQYDI